MGQDYPSGRAKKICDFIRNGKSFSTGWAAEELAANLSLGEEFFGSKGYDDYMQRSAENVRGTCHDRILWDSRG